MTIDVTGSRIYFVIPFLGGIPITSTIVNAWLVIAIIGAVCFFLTRNMKTHASTKKQHIAELLVIKVTDWVQDNMGTQYSQGHFPAFAGALFSLSVLCSLISLLGFYPPTADLSTTMGWSLLVFAMITYTKIRTNRLSGYLRDFTKPIIVLTPLNIISELSTPVSMAFRHFGNIASGQVVSALIYAVLMLLNQAVFGWLPGALGQVLSVIPIVQVGIPAFLSLYFDLFAGLMQAFIFCMLTMNYVSAAAETE